MRKGISITVTAGDRVRLGTIIRNRNSAELRPGPARWAAGYAIPMHGEGAGLGVAAVLVERAAWPT
jgi:hypothetical protein